MATGIYTGVGGVKAMKEMYIGVNGSVRKVKEAYVGYEWGGVNKVYQSKMWLYNRGNNIAKFTVSKGSFQNNYIQWVYDFNGEGAIKSSFPIQWDNYNSLCIRIILHSIENASKPKTNVIVSVDTENGHQPTARLENVPDQKEVLLKLDVFAYQGTGQRLLIYAREVSTTYGRSPKAEIYEVYLE